MLLPNRESRRKAPIFADPTPMSASANAIFFSYASRDAEAARRICDMLRAGSH